MELALWTKMTLNSERFTCLFLSSAQIKGMDHHAQLELNFKQKCNPNSNTNTNSLFKQALVQDLVLTLILTQNTNPNCNQLTIQNLNYKS